jgi:DNA-binding transcriptional regulator GbsR (MarR family)
MSDAVARAKQTLLEGVGAEVAASFPGITRLGGQIVAALYLAEEPRSMDQLAAELGCSKSNIFSNLRGLDAAGIVEKQRVSGARFDVFALRGKYPDVMIGAYIARLRRVIVDKQMLSSRALEMLGAARGKEADALRTRLHALSRKYERFGAVFDLLLPASDGPVDLEALLSKVPTKLLAAVGALTKRALSKRR